MSLATSLYGMQVIVSETIKEQFRFPRTKKRRIRNKWSKREENWRPSSKALIMHKVMYVHPKFYDQLLNALKVDKTP